MRRAVAIAALSLLLGAPAQAKPAKRHAAPAHKPAPAHTQERTVAPAPPPADSEASSEGSGEVASEDARPAGEA